MQTSSLRLIRWPVNAHLDAKMKFPFKFCVWVLGKCYLSLSKNVLIRPKSTIYNCMGNQRLLGSLLVWFKSLWAFSWVSRSERPSKEILGWWSYTGKSCSSNILSGFISRCNIPSEWMLLNNCKIWIPIFRASCFLINLLPFWST